MKQFSEETRRRMSESAKKRCSDPIWLANQHARGTSLPFDKVVSMYEQGHTQEEIGSALGVSQKVVWRFMKNHGIKSRQAKKRNQHGKSNNSWKGGTITDDAGYVLVRAEGHPRAKKHGLYVREHILVAERFLGRFLTPNEVVHHINGVKSDNRPENLSVMTRSAHASFHKRGLEAPPPIAVTKIRIGGAE